MQISIAIIVGTLALSGCASSREAPQRAPAAPETRAEAPPPERRAEAPPPERAANGGMTPGPMKQELEEMCPMAVEGATMMAAEVEGGIAVVLTTTGDVDDLRRRAELMAETHNRRYGGEQRSLPEDDQTRRGADGMRERRGMMNGGMMMPPSTVHVVEVENGVGLLFTPHDPADLPMLRERMEERAVHMASGQCPMVGDDPATAPSDDY